MSEKLKKLIKPCIAAALTATVLIAAYFSGGDVSAPVDKDAAPVTKASAVTTTELAVTTSVQTQKTEASSAASTTAKSSSVSESSSTVSAVTSSNKTTQSTAARTTRKTTSASSVRASAEAQTMAETQPVTAVNTYETAAGLTEPYIQSETAEASPEITSVTTEETRQTSAPLPQTTAQTSASSSPKHDTCSIMISCSTVFDNTDKIDKAILKEQPADGMILPRTEVETDTGSTVFDLLRAVCSEKGIPLEYSRIAATNNYYIEGINNLYEFDAGNLSGWMYSVNGHFPQMSTSQYAVKAGDVIEVVYSCSIGVDVGDDYYNKAG